MQAHHRKSFRHAVDLGCQIVRERDFRLVATCALDLSTDGLLAATDLPVLTGEALVVSFRAPRSSRWIDAEAVVTRVDHGRRPGERGRRLGIAFHGLGQEERHHLFQALRMLPPASARQSEGARRDEGARAH